MSLTRAAHEYLADLGVTFERFSGHRITGSRVFELDVENLALNTEHLLDMARRSGNRRVPVRMVQQWVDLAAETAEADERTLLAEEIETRFGLQADIRHTADIHSSKVDAYAAHFNSRLREAWEAQGVPADVPDEYFDRCTAAGMTPEQCGGSWRDGIPLDYIP